MTATELAIARNYYRLVYERKVMSFKDVPEIYKPLVLQYKRDLESK